MLRDLAKVIAARRATTTVKALIVVDFMTNSPDQRSGNRRDVATVASDVINVPADILSCIPDDYAVFVFPLRWDTRSFSSISF